jgi:hypothetical protein
VREYGQGGVLMALTDAEKQLDAANRKAGQAELVAQAHDPLPMKLAADAARSAIERSFAMPLKAAGVGCDGRRALPRRRALDDGRAHRS